MQLARIIGDGRLTSTPHTHLPRLVLSGKPEMDDWLTTLVDEYYLENEGYIVGDLIKSTFSIPLSYIDELEAIPIDREIQNILENDIFPLEILNNTTSIQNSCSNSTTIDCQMKIQLYAIQTCGDGDCLLHAISLGLWGKDDSKHYLRGLLSLTLTSTNFKKKLLPYWCEEEYYRDYSLGFQNARTLEEIQNEFEIAVNIAHQPGRYLEGIHIATLSHMLRRPIICYSQDISDSKNDMTGQSLSGIYLPILHDPKNCCKTPLCIVYTSTLKDSSNNESRKDSQFAFGVGHYSAVIGVDYKSSTQYNSMSTSEKDQEWIGCFPVVNANSRVLPLRYCFPFDQDTTLSFRKNNNASDQLLRSYLIIRECSLSSDTRKKVPVALSFNPDDPNNSLTNVGSIRDMGSTSSFVSKSKQQFFGKVLDSKRSELDLLRAKIREIEEQMSQIQEDIREIGDVELTKRRRERNSLLDYQTLKREQEKSSILRRQTRENDGRKERIKDHGSRAENNEPAPETTTMHRSSTNRAGTPKRAYPPTNSPDKEMYQSLQKEQERSTIFRPHSQETNGRKERTTNNDSSGTETKEPAPETTTMHRSTTDRAGTPKRAYPPTYSPDNKDSSSSSRSTAGSGQKPLKYTPSQDRLEKWKSLGLEYYNGELMTVQEAQELKNALKLSLLTCNDKNDIDEKGDQNQTQSGNQEIQEDNNAAPESSHRTDLTYASNVPRRMPPSFNWALERPTYQSKSSVSETYLRERPKSASRVTSRPTTDHTLSRGNYIPSSSSLLSPPSLTSRVTSRPITDHTLSRGNYMPSSSSLLSSPSLTPSSARNRAGSAPRNRWI